MSDIEPSGPRNYDLTSEEIALQQIFAATGYRVPASKVRLGPASVLDQFPEVLTDENSFTPAVVQDIEDGRLVGDNGFIYRRLPITELLTGSPLPSIPLSYPFTTHGILPLLNAVLKTKLDKDDVEDDTFLDANTPFVLRTKPGSLAWLGEMALSLHDPDQQFLVPNPLVLGFTEDTSGQFPNPYYGSSVSRLTATLNANVETPLIEGVDFVYGPLVELTTTPPWNSRIRIIPLSTDVFAEQDVFFTRLSLSALSRLPGAFPPVPVFSTSFSIHQILNEINSALGLSLLPSEVFNTHYSTLAGRHRLQIKPGASVAWEASYFDFEVIYVSVGGERTMEDGSARETEDGMHRQLEDAPE